jgi:hypothetical protein
VSPGVVLAAVNVIAVNAGAGQHPPPVAGVVCKCVCKQSGAECPTTVRQQGTVCKRDKANGWSTSYDIHHSCHTPCTVRRRAMFHVCIARTVKLLVNCSAFGV